MQYSVAPHQVIFVEGARQVGKTTLIEQALVGLDNVFSVNLEVNARLRKKVDQTQSFEEFRTIVSAELRLPKQTDFVLFIDEAQESEMLGAYVRSIKEQWRNARVILSGSSMKRIFRSDVRVPVGRFDRLILKPFSFSEFLLAVGKSSYVELLTQFSPQTATKLTPLLHDALLAEFDQYLAVGGLPRVVTTFVAGADYAAVREEIVLQQEEDFVRKERLENSHFFDLALSAVADHLGYPSKNSYIDCSSRESKALFARLEDWHLVQRINQRSFSSTSQFYPKRYLYDLGVAQYVRQHPFPDLSILSSSNKVLRGQLGGLFENAVLLGLQSDQLTPVRILSWRQGAQNKSEIDFVLREQISIPIEVKAKLKISPRVFAPLRRYLKDTDQQLGIVVSAAPFRLIEEGGMKLVNLPIYLAKLPVIQSLVEELGVGAR